MALNSTIHRVELAIADVDRGYYHEHTLTMARHPSETEERMMVRLLAFAMHAGPGLAFGSGLSDVDEPDLLLVDDTGAVALWIEVGLLDERRIRRACSRAAQVVLFSYGRQAARWWQQNEADLARFERLSVIELPAASTHELATLAGRTMRLQASATEGIWWISNATQAVTVEPLVRKRAAG